MLISWKCVAVVEALWEVWSVCVEAGRVEEALANFLVSVKARLRWGRNLRVVGLGDFKNGPRSEKGFAALHYGAAEQQ